MRDHDALIPDDFLSPDEGVLDRYLAGECTDAERQVVDAWLGEHPDVAARLAAVAYSAAYPVGGMRETGGLAQYARFQDRVAAVVSGVAGLRWWGVRRGTFKGPLSQGIWYALATVVVGVLGITIGWTGGTHRLLEWTPRSASTYATTDGQRATITLLDGTTVALDVASRLDVPADFVAGNHTVTLTGEGFFMVSHHDGRPFTVLSGATKTQVLGTSFVVRHYPGDTTTMVAVRDGKVMVDSSIVTPQRLVEIGHDGTVRGRRVDLATFSFATGTLVLNDMPLPNAIAELDRWFDVDIRLGDSALARQRIAGRFAAGSLADLTDLFEMGNNVRVVRNGRVLTLYPRS